MLCSHQNFKNGKDIGYLLLTKKLLKITPIYYISFPVGQLFRYIVTDCLWLTASEVSVGMVMPGAVICGWPTPKSLPPMVVVKIQFLLGCWTESLSSSWLLAGGLPQFFAVYRPFWGVIWQDGIWLSSEQARECEGRVKTESRVGGATEREKL